MRFRTIGPFTRRQPPDGLPEAVLKALGDAPALTLTDFIVEKDDAYLVYVAGKRKPRLDAASGEYRQTAARQMGAAAENYRTAVIKDMVQAELAKTAKMGE